MYLEVIRQNIRSATSCYVSEKFHNEASYILLENGNKILFLRTQAFANLRDDQIILSQNHRSILYVEYNLKIKVNKIDPLEYPIADILIVSDSKVTSNFRAVVADTPLITGLNYLASSAGKYEFITIKSLYINKGKELINIARINENTKIINNELSSINNDYSDVQIDFSQELINLNIGGLQHIYSEIFRRVFASRLLSQELIDEMQIKHVRGLLLYGPPGTGKTLIARAFAKILGSSEPKLISGPEILSKWVGQSEQNLRTLFEDAEKNPNKLSVIIFDEIDALFKTRGSSASTNSAGDNLVNQLLAKMDGLVQLNNILLIAMTNRKDLLDPALLRPGRFEVQIQIPLPDEKGRFEILRVHTSRLKLSEDVNLEQIAFNTRNYSGAELEGIVKSALSKSIERIIKYKDDKTSKIDEKDKNGIIITSEDFQTGLCDIRPKCIVHKSSNLIFPSEYTSLYNILKKCINQIYEDTSFSFQYSIFLKGISGSGKTTICNIIAKELKLPVILIDRYMLCKNNILDVYNEANNYQHCLILLENIEQLIEYTEINSIYNGGVRFNVLNDILYILSSSKTNRIITIVTSQCDILNTFDTLNQIIDVKLDMPLINVKDTGIISFMEENKINKSKYENLHDNVPIKKLFN